LQEFRVVVARLPDTSIRDYPTEMGLCVGRLQEEVQQQEADEPSEGGPSQVLTLHMDEAGVAGKVRRGTRGRAGWGKKQEQGRVWAAFTLGPTTMHPSCMPLCVIECKLCTVWGTSPWLVSFIDITR
jgi:hypothetical protein